MKGNKVEKKKMELGMNAGGLGGGEFNEKYSTVPNKSEMPKRKKFKRPTSQTPKKALALGEIIETSNLAAIDDLEKQEKMKFNGILKSKQLNHLITSPV